MTEVPLQLSIDHHGKIQRYANNAESWIMKNHWCPVLKHLAQEQNENKQTNQKIAERVNPSVNIRIPGLKKKKKEPKNPNVFTPTVRVFFDCLFFPLSRTYEKIEPFIYIQNTVCVWLQLGSFWKTGSEQYNMQYTVTCFNS